MAVKKTKSEVKRRIGDIKGSVAVNAKNPTGRRAAKKLLKTEGNWDAGNSGGLNVSSGCETIFFSVREKIGPATMIVGMAIIIP